MNRKKLNVQIFSQAFYRPNVPANSLIQHEAKIRVSEASRGDGKSGRKQKPTPKPSPLDTLQGRRWWPLRSSRRKLPEARAHLEYVQDLLHVDLNDDSLDTEPSGRQAPFC